MEKGRNLTFKEIQNMKENLDIIEDGMEQDMMKMVIKYMN